MICLSKKPAVGFTLVELMVAITIIAILATTILFGMAGVQDTAKAQRTKSQIARIHEMLAEKWESYETRSISITGTPVSANAGINRLAALRELIRLELPDRQTDVMPSQSLVPTAPADSTFTYQGSNYKCRTGLVVPSLYRYYVSRMSSGWSKQNEGAECLYLILSRIQIGDSNGLEFFSEREIGDTDDDQMPEILDGWGNPIHFVRWAPGYANQRLEDQAIRRQQAGTSKKINFGRQVSAYQTGPPAGGPDTMDLASTDPRLRDTDVTNDTFALFPLVVSSGPDGVLGIGVDFADASGITPVLYRDTNIMPYQSYGLPLTSDPFVFVEDPNPDPSDPGGEPVISMLGMPTSESHLDNISNHVVDTKL